MGHTMIDHTYGWFLCRKPLAEHIGAHPSVFTHDNFLTKALIKVQEVDAGVSLTSFLLVSFTTSTAYTLNGKLILNSLHPHLA